MGPVTPESPAGHAPSLPCRRGPKAGLLAAGPICAVGGELGTPQGDYHPLGLAAPQVTLIRASSPGAWGELLSLDPMWPLVGSWDTGSSGQYGHGEKSASQGARRQQPPLGFLKRAAGLVPVGVCSGGNCLLEMGHSYTP